MRIPWRASHPNGRQTAEAFQRQLKERQDAAAQSGQPRTDPAALPFHIDMEVKRAPVSETNRELVPYGFAASAVVPNCSHGFSAGYTRVNSSTTTIAQGGLQQIADALEQLKKSGVTVGRTCAMRIYYHGPLTAQATRNLINIQAAHEDLLYRAARGGARGRSRLHKQEFARRLNSRPHTSGHWSDPRRAVREGTWQSLQQKYLGMNTFNGELEFRYFDATLHAPAIQANVALVLSMIAAAIDGRLQAPDDLPKSWWGRMCTRSQRWNRLTEETVGKGPIEAQLSKQL